MNHSGPDAHILETVWHGTSEYSERDAEQVHEFNHRFSHMQYRQDVLLTILTKTYR